MLGRSEMYAGTPKINVIANCSTVLCDIYSASVPRFMPTDLLVRASTLDTGVTASSPMGLAYNDIQNQTLERRSHSTDKLCVKAGHKRRCESPPKQERCFDKPPLFDEPPEQVQLINDELTMPLKRRCLAEDESSGPDTG